MSAASKISEQNYNYVYLYADNYMNTSKESPMVVFKEIRTSILRDIHSKIDQETLDRMADKYNSGKNLLLGISEGGASKDINIQEIITNILNENLGMDLSEVWDINFDKLSISRKAGNAASTENMLSRVARLRNRVKENETRAKVNFSTLKKRIDNLKNALAAAAENLDPNDINSQEDLNKMNSQVNLLWEILLKIFNKKEAANLPKDSFAGKMTKTPTSLKELHSLLKEAGLPVPKEAWTNSPTTFEISGNRLDIGTARALRNVLNAIIATSINGFKQLILGDLFEMFLYATFEIGDDIAEKAFENKIRESLKGGGHNQTIGKLIIEGNEGILKQLLSEVSHTVTDLGNGKISATMSYSSQQKADIIINFEDKEYGISAKNYADIFYSKNNFIKKMSLSSGSPLITHLLGANSLHSKASRHFLNILAYHTDSNVKGKGFKALREVGIDTLLLTILWQAATGKGVGKEKGFAEILAWNDNKTGTVRFFDINTILSNIENKNKSSMVSPNLSTLNLNNRKIYSKSGMSDAIKQRLSNVLQDAHAKKIKAGIPMEFLKTIPHASTK